MCVCFYLYVCSYTHMRTNAKAHIYAFMGEVGIGKEPGNFL